MVGADASLSESGNFYPATVTSVKTNNNGDKVFGIAYDDGDTEENVERRMIELRTDDSSDAEYGCQTAGVADFATTTDDEHHAQRK